MNSHDIIKAKGTILWGNGFDLIGMISFSVQPAKNDWIINFSVMSPKGE